MIMIRDIDSTSHKNILFDHDPLDRADVYTVGKRSIIADLNGRMEVLAAVASYCFEPQIPRGVDISLKGNMLGPFHLATRTEVQAWGMQHPAHCQVLHHC